MHDLTRIEQKDMRAIRNDFSFYDFQDQDSIEKSIVVELNTEEIVTYNDLYFGKSKKKFLSQKKKIIRFIVQFLQMKKEDYCILSKYHDDKWLVNKKRDYYLYKFLKKNNVKNKFKGGIKVLCNGKVFLSFVNSNIKYNSFFNILMPNNRIIITPTDHMDIFFDAENIEKVKIDLEKLLSKDNFFKMRFYEPENPSI